MASSDDMTDNFGKKMIEELIINEDNSLSEESINNKIFNPSDIKYIDDNGEEVSFSDKTWEIIKSFIRDQQNPLVSHQISSFNDFIANPEQNILTKIICEEKQFNPIVLYSDINPETKLPNLEYKLTFTKVSVSKPIINETNGKEKPLTPNEARLRNFAYCSNVYVDIEHQIRKRINEDTWSEPSKTSVKQIMIGRIPIMLGSKLCVLSEKNTQSRRELGECKYDQFGYFIINGQEKVLVSHEKLVENKPCVFYAKNNKYSIFCEVHSVNDNRYNIAKKTVVKLTNKDNAGIGNTIKVSVQGFKTDIPLFLILRALGINSDKEIMKLCAYDLNDSELTQLLLPSSEEGILALTQKDAIDELIKNISINSITNYNLSAKEKKENKIKSLNDIFLNYLLPHLNHETEEDKQTNFYRKAYYLGYMVNRMLNCLLKRRNYDDRDNLCNKKLETAGTLTAFLFCVIWRQKTLKNFVRDIKKDLSSIQGGIENIKIEKYLKPTIIDTGIKRSFSIGDWGAKQNSNNRKGVSQLVVRHNYKSALSHTRRVITPLDSKSSKVTGPHMLHGSHWGYLCAAETPDGPQIGVNKNLTFTSTITNYVNPINVFEILDYNETTMLEEFNNFTDLKNNTKVFVNGVWTGIHNNPKKLYDSLIMARRNGILHMHTSITWYHEYGELWIFTDAGRLIRPLYIVDNNKLRLTNKIIDDISSSKIKWQDLFGIKQIIDLEDDTSDISKLSDNSIIEYIDVNEVEKCMIATTPNDLHNNNIDNPTYLNYTHCEFHPSMIFGVVISDQPLSNHNAGPRVIYFANQCKQSLGLIGTNIKDRIDTIMHMLHHPQKPLVTTSLSRITPGYELASGQTAIIAIQCYTGYNQEDSLLINGNAIDRGLFNSTYYRKHWDEEKKNHQELQDEKFTKPGKNVIQAKENYDALDSNGFAKIGTKVVGGQVIIGKLVPVKQEKDSIQKYRDASTTMKHNDVGYIDNVKWDINGDGYRFCKVKVRTVRQPEIGDKLACYDTETEILTENKGWIKFNKLDYTDKVASLIDNKLVYQNPTEIMSYEHNGKMYKIKNQNIDLLVTPNHRLFLNNNKIIRCDNLYTINNSNMFMTDINNNKLKFKNTDVSVIDYNNKVYCCTVEGNGIIYVRRNKIPVWCGNSRHAQKGTIGMILPQEDMPFNKDGISPDLIMNPHGIPTRMTLGHMIETLMGRVCCMKGIEADGTPFNGLSIKKVCKILGTPIEEGGCGFTEVTKPDGKYGYGTEVLYSGMSGEQFAVRVFMGPTYYYRLKHMVADKMHSRSTGPMTMHTRQPSEGRSREGGFRIGEMERDCIIAHGTAFFLKERLLDVSDLYKVYINRKNGLIAIGNPEKGTLKNDQTDSKPVYIPYAFKLLMQELMAIGIVPRLIVD